MSFTALTRRLLFIAVAACALCVTPFALAKGGKADPSVTVGPAGPYAFGQAIYVSTNDPIYPNNAGPWIEMACSQNGVIVGTSDAAGFPGGIGYQDPLYLGPSASWTGGAADCTVTVVHLNNNKVVTDATTSFHVDG